jgi:soluble epoxide hydrolase/lipid-phosphate phosphatase
MEKHDYRAFTTSRGFTYSYFRGDPSEKVLDTWDQLLPVLLFLHGFLTSSLVWKHQIKYFREQGFIVIAPDLLGLGDTSKPLDPEAYRASLICQDLIELLDAENLPNDHVIAVGHDQLSIFSDYVTEWPK